MIDGSVTEKDFMQGRLYDVAELFIVSSGLTCMYRERYAWVLYRGCDCMVRLTDLYVCYRQSV